MKHDDTTLQAAIDAAMIEIGRQDDERIFVACPDEHPISWYRDATIRLTLAKAFLAKLPEPQPILAGYCKSQAETIGILRPLSEAGPVLDGCARIYGHVYDDMWYLGWQKDDKDTHFADIRLPSTETSAPTVNNQPKQKVPLGPEDVLPGAIVTNSADFWYKVKYVTASGMRIDIQGSRLIDYEELANGWQINRSIPLTGKWDATAWEPCYKMI